MIKVFVFKKRYCPDCKEALKISADGNTLNCLKCQKEFHREIGEEYIKLGVSIEGSTRDFQTAEKNRQTGFIEVEKVMIPEEQMCKKCRNRQHQYEQAALIRERKIARGEADVHAFPKGVTDAQVFRYEINRKIQDGLRERMQREEQEKQQKAQEAAAKAKLVQDMASKLSEDKKE
jgi:hypothetical protein